MHLQRTGRYRYIGAFFTTLTCTLQDPTWGVVVSRKRNATEAVAETVKQEMEGTELAPAVEIAPNAVELAAGVSSVVIVRPRVDRKVNADLHANIVVYHAALLSFFDGTQECGLKALTVPPAPLLAIAGASATMY